MSEFVLSLADRNLIIYPKWLDQKKKEKNSSNSKKTEISNSANPQSSDIHEINQPTITSRKFLHEIYYE